MNYRLISFLILIFICSRSWAVDDLSAGSREIYETYRSIRALGMGNAFSAVVDDGDSLFYNPAGLAKNSGIYWTIVDPAVGISNPDGLSNFQGLQDAVDFQTTLNSIMGEHMWAGGNAKTLFYMPYLAVGFYQTADVSFVANNPINPELFFNYIQDKGYVIGTGFQLLPFVDVGASVRQVTRVGRRARYGPSIIDDIINGGSDPALIFDDLFGTSGVGYGFDLGVNFHIDSVIAPTFSFVWKNVGNTKFSASGSTGVAPPTDESEMIVGAAVVVDTPIVSIRPSLDIKHLNRTDQQLGKKIHLGFEIDVPFVDIRAGLHQGYLSYGVGLDLGIMRVDAASWGVEVGAYPGQIEDRRYAVQLTFEFGLDLGLASSTRSSKKSGGDSATSGSSSSGGRGGDRKALKIRR